MISLKILVAPFSLMFLVLFGIFWIYPEYKVAKEKEEMISNSEAVLQKNLTMTKNGETLLSDLRSNKEKINSLLKVLPRQGSEEEALWFLGQLAQNSGMTLTSVSLGESSEETPPLASEVPGQTFKDAISGIETTAENTGLQIDPGTLSVKYASVSFSSVGTYESMQKFLSSLRGFPRVVREDSVSVKVERDEKTGALFQMSGSIGFAYAPIKRVGSGTISPAFETSSFDFGSLDQKQQGFGSYPIPQEIPSGRPNPFVP